METKKKKYIKPIVERITIETDDEICKQSWSEAHEHHPNKHTHCGNCKYDGEDEYWHCDHSINGWTDEPFYPECDFYLP